MTTTSPGIEAIETEYAGYRFRSRLEARWAVVFDQLKITWRYEDQGYTLSTGRRYLPDFVLEDRVFPNQEVFVEVKGKLENQHVRDLARLVVDTGQPGVVLGEIPDPDGLWSAFPLFTVPMGLRPCDADGRMLMLDAATFMDCRDGWRLIRFGLARPMTHVRPEATDVRLLQSHLPQLPGLLNLLGAGDAYRAGRGARFEHGASGAAR
jgi:hypothetical protein